ncbi:inner membrane protein YpjD [Endozoicomonas sp. 8E]|uniref:cytochrome C assembly family protein n=1 Tax=Endozoicomonas sp. 8E TaxID=3035692 RepID=UPI0029394507|nr:cytochrome c biogenesis protein CcsA [Endozoicomonas sp. 8E]WOG25620.1 cytochrome c biogenesis protein CcsA [Endozoicomonas sp. 8E]
MEVIKESMNFMLVSIGAIIFYAVGMVCQWGRITGRGGARNLVLLAITVGAALHIFSLYFSIHTDKGTNLGILTIGSLTTLIVTLVVLLSSLRKPSESLLVTILPFTIISVLADWLAPVEHIFHSPTLMVVHVLLSVLAYGLLMVAVCQSLLLAYQEKQLRSHNQKRLLKALPPLQTMEKLLFEFLSVGVILLTLSLISGFLYIDNMFASDMFHKTVLSLVAWVLFTTLLIGRWVNGWRGQKAMRWTVAGFILLLVAYFGWRTVVDFILVR